MVDQIEARYGRPGEAAFLADSTPAEFAFLKQTIRDGRSQDVTLLVRRAALVAMIRKPAYPPGCFRAPGGTAKPGEDLVAAGVREGREETGLDVRFERYIVRAHVTFRCGTESIQWVTHVFTAAADSGELEPRDRAEVAEARWFTPEEYRRMNTTLACAPLSGLRYRAALQEAAWAALRQSP